MINKIRKFLTVIVINLFLFPALSLAVCPEVKGLYEKRKGLFRKYVRDYSESRSMADEYERQMQIIDEKYRGVIHEMFYEHEKKEYNVFRKCCVSPIKDGYLFYVCKLIAFYRDGNAGPFLKDIPVNKESLSDLWQIDYIIFRQIGYFDYSSKPHPRLFDRGSFVDLFIDSLYGLAENGNATAVDKYLGINSFADGSVGEYMEDKILNLFENHPSIVLGNWKVIRKHKSTIGFGTTDYSYKADAIIRKYQDLFEREKTDPSVSKEILEFLREKKE